MYSFGDRIKVVASNHVCFCVTFFFFFKGSGKLLEGIVRVKFISASTVRKATQNPVTDTGVHKYILRLAHAHFC